jgi:SAM-dependent methyltransferase
MPFMAIQLWMNHFWEGLLTGNFIPKTEQEVRDYIAQNHFGGEALVELSDEDKQTILPSMFKKIEFSANWQGLKKLCEQKVYYFQEENGVWGASHNLVLEESNESKRGKQPLSRESKVALLSNPDIWFNSRCHSKGGSVPLGNWGMRPIESYGLEEEIPSILDRIRKNTGKSLVNVLDVGGAGGIALRDIKKIDKNVSTWDMTLDVEPVMHDFDRLYLCTAERFPAELRESADLIISHYSFCYFAGQAQAINNCLQSLSVGGEAHLSVCWGKQYTFVSNPVERMRKQYDQLITLRDSGKIELEVRDWNGISALSYRPENFKENSEYGENFYPPAFVKIKKLKSTA